ncbi:hypothetical protein BC941DRAFT_423378 [Chlamydoabsidia padenii]|nr:hypothetical protein BC941DRAFT_423378 [Chlamydoabsidia padenii]
MGYLPGAFSTTNTSNKVSIVWDDITKLHVDALVNPTNPNFYIGGARTASYAIMKGAGPGLIDELQLRRPLEYGDAVTTPSFELPCHYIIHTAVPSVSFPDADDLLRNCYRNSLLQLVGQKKETIAFPCMGTGVQRFDHERAAHLAMGVVRDFFNNDHSNQVKHVVFCVYSGQDRDLYRRYLSTYFG